MIFYYFVMDAVFHLVYKTRAFGAENVPKKGGLFLASNHTSMMDTMIIPYFSLNRFSWRRFRNPGKEELFSNPFKSLIVKSTGAFPVKRRSRDVSAMKKIINIVQKDVIVIFPEGTRNKGSDLLPGSPGIGRLIHEAKVPVIPTYVINTRHAWYSGNLLPNFFQKMYVAFGKPLELERYFKQEGSKAIYREIVKYLMDEIAKLQEEHKDIEKPPSAPLDASKGAPSDASERAPAGE
jgi:1-acyl-sn-glycerol-3-phosphate acyltransferase